MRPLSLELEGFGAYRDRTPVDLAGAELFAIVGATGHGKSTLIDAICFALYGKVPRHGEREIAPAMTLGVNETKVSFTFELAGATYVATRVLRRRASGEGTTTRALRLELVGADGTNEVLAGSAAEFAERIQRLIGLDFDQFTKCVVLPQGQFAAFLHARAGERVAILSALLELGRYDRMATGARDRAKRAAGHGEALTAERSRIGDVSAASVDAARAHRDALLSLQGDIESAAPRDAVLAEEALTARADADRARTAVQALAEVHVPDDARDLAVNAARAREDAELAASANDSAEARATELSAAAAELPSAETLAAARAAHADRSGLVERIANGEKVLTERAAAAESARATLVAAQQRQEAAQVALLEAQRHDAHAELRSSLRAGEPCPVCEQPVAKLPRKLAASALAKARTAAATEQDAVKKAEADAHGALDELRRADSLLASLRERLGECDGRLDAFPDLGELDTRATEVQAAREIAVAARRAADEARGYAQQRAQAATAADKALRRTEARMQQQRDALMLAGLKPPTGDPDDLTSTWAALASWAAEAAPDHEKRATASDDLARARSAERDALLGELGARADALRVDPHECASVSALLTPVVAAARDAAHAVDEATTRLARAAELDADIAASRAAELVAAELGVLLDKRHFGQWLVDEALHGLVEGASALLERLSGGQYALAVRDDGELLVIDHVNADERRSVRSLSGGETFQASLALALALSDRIAAPLAPDGAATLESIFLDEGFGTLDPETLDVVAGTIESLGQGERVIGVVTHVAELAERMPVRFRVRKEGRTAGVTREES